MVTYIFGATILLASAIFSCRLLLPVFLLPLSFNRANSEQVYWRAEAWRPLGWNMFLKISFTFISNLATYKGRLIRQFHEAQVKLLLIYLEVLRDKFRGQTRWNGIWTLWFVRMSVLIKITLECSLVHAKVRFSVYKLRRRDQSLLRGWRRNMVMSQDVSRTYVQTHSAEGQSLLQLPRRFIKSAVALCFNSPKYLFRWTRQLRRHHNRPHKF